MNPLILRIRLAVALVLLVAALVLPSVALADPPSPAPGVADVDGAEAEWDLTADFFADMYRAADPDKPVQSKLYLRYECATETLYALVLPVAPYVIAAEPTNTFIKLGNNVTLVNGNSGDDGTAPDFQWINVSGDEADGWEASAQLAPGLYTDLNVHTNVWDEDGQSQTSAVSGRAIELNLACSPTAVTLSGFEATGHGAFPYLLGAGLALGVTAVWVARRHGRTA